MAEMPQKLIQLNFIPSVEQFQEASNGNLVPISSLELHASNRNESPSVNGKHSHLQTGQQTFKYNDTRSNSKSPKEADQPSREPDAIEDEYN